MDGEKLREVLELHRKWLDKAEGGVRADLRGADLQGAYLQRADLRGVDLQGADLRGAGLQGADLRGAGLQRADLRGAYLRGAYLQRAYLQGARLIWTSHELLAEILRRAAGDDVQKLMVAGLPLVTQEWCWGQYKHLDLPKELKDWAVTTLAAWYQDGDEAPKMIKEAALRLRKEKEDERKADATETEGKGDIPA